MTLQLPASVLTDDPSVWRHPTPFEIRQVVGIDSATGVSISVAARLVGVAPTNFKKYVRHEGAATVAKMSFAMWHLLLHRTGVQASKVVEKSFQN